VIALTRSARVSRAWPCIACGHLRREHDDQQQGEPARAVCVHRMGPPMRALGMAGAVTPVCGCDEFSTLEVAR
jgi:hypothetical protein